MVTLWRSGGSVRGGVCAWRPGAPLRPRGAGLARRGLMDLAKLLEWKGPPPPAALNITEIRRTIVAPDGTVLKTLPSIPRWSPPPRPA